MGGACDIKKVQYGENPWIGCFKSQKITKSHLLICDLENGLRNT
jgi:hypothetical protein